MHLLSCNVFIYSLQVLAAVSLVIPKAAAFAEDQDPLPFNDDQTKGIQVGDVYEVNISSTYDKSDIKPVTSEDSKTDTYTLTYVNASYISVHFRQFDLPSSCSLAMTTDDNGEEEEQPYTLTGQGKFDLGTFWAHHVNGDTMKLSLSCDEEEEKEFALFEIDQFAAGFPLNNNPELHPNERHLRSRRTKKERSVGENKIPSFLKAIDEERKLSICGIDDKRNAICYKDSEPTIYNKAKAVARLLINGRSACTGWLVSEGSLLFTNEHCIDSLSDVQNTDFEFMGEESQCAIGSSDGSWFSSRNRDGIYDGNALLKVSATWDYALIQLSGNPASKYGFLELDNRKASVNEQIYIPQHPGGRPKEIGVIDSNHDGNCRVKGYRRGCAPEDMTYSCDTEGGSSGSPVLSRTNNKVIALHHCGGGCNGNLGAPIYKFYNEIQGFIGTVPAPTPTASDLDNYNFYPYMDSGGNDITNVSGGINAAAAACNANPSCQGFNSNGWAKHTVRNQSQWSRWTNDPTKGFYVKKGDTPTSTPSAPVPTPTTASDLDNYNFYPYMDSGGNDITNVSGGINAAAAACNANLSCQGFNSNGWIKHTLRDQSQWSRWTNDPTKGFYVKR